MEFDYTGHAKENITERKLSKEAIEEVVKNPEKVTEGRFGRSARAHKCSVGCARQRPKRFMEK